MASTIEVMSEENWVDIIPLRAVVSIRGYPNHTNCKLIVMGSDATLYMPSGCSHSSHTNKNPAYTTYTVYMPQSVLSALVYSNPEAETYNDTVIDLKPFSGREAKSWDPELLDKIVSRREPVLPRIL